MSKFLKGLGVLLVVGAVANVLVKPADQTSSVSQSAGTPSSTSRLPEGYEADLVKRAEEARVQIQKEQPVVNRESMAKVQKCFDANNCAFHLVGIASEKPYLQLSVMETEARSWNDADWFAAVSHAKERGRWARANPRDAVLQYDTLPETAPFFAAGVANVSKRLKSVSVGTTNERKTKEPRRGVPGWTAKNDASRSMLPV